MNEKSSLQKNRYLFIDTSTEKAVVAVIFDGNFLDKKEWEAKRILSDTLLRNYQELLAKNKISQNELTGVVVYPGPGSFTGLRIGIAFANALAFGLKIPMFRGDKKGSFNLAEVQEIIIPLYGAEPNITKPKEKN